MSSSDDKKKPEFANFEEFWSFYVREHSNKNNRRLHFAGTSLGLGCVAASFLLKKRWMLLAAPVLGYGGAWIGHFAFEKNVPATFKYPLWSFVSDWKMYAKILTGTMDQEVADELAEHEAKTRAEAEAAAKSADDSAQRSADLN